MPSDALDFSRRAQLTELMDEPCSYAEFRDCLRDLMRVNRTVLAYRPTLEWLEQFSRNAGEPLNIVDVGCGAGDMLLRIERWARRRDIAVRLTGIDRNPYAACAAREFCGPGSSIDWITCDAYTYQPSNRVDLVISSLFTHHLLNEEIVEFLLWMERTAARGWFINDLHRGAIPYYTFAVLAKVMNWHRFVLHDGPVSVRRSFSVEDWKCYLHSAELDAHNVSVYSRRPARLCISRVKR